MESLPSQEDNNQIPENRAHSYTCNMFTKLGICLNILPYFDYLHKTRHLMMQLFSGSRQLWIEENQKIIENMHECMQLVEISDANMEIVRKLFKLPERIPADKSKRQSLACAYTTYKYFKFAIRVSVSSSRLSCESQSEEIIELLRKFYPLGKLRVESVMFYKSPTQYHYAALDESVLKETNDTVDAVIGLLGLECQVLDSQKYLAPPMVKLQNNYIRGYNRLYLERDVEIKEELFELSYLGFTREFNKLIRTKSTYTLELFIDQFITLGNPLPEFLEEITIIASTPSYQSEDAKQQCDVTQLIDVIEPQHKLKFIFKELSSFESRNNLCLVSKLREFAGVQVHAEFTNTNKDAFILHCLHCMLCLNVEDATKTTYFKNVRIDCGVEDISFVSDNEYILIRSVCSLKGTTQVECPSGREFATFIDSFDLINEKSTMIAVKVLDISSLALNKHFDEFVNQPEMKNEEEESKQTCLNFENWRKLPSFLNNDSSMKAILKVNVKDLEILRCIPKGVKIKSLSLSLPKTLDLDLTTTVSLIDEFLDQLNQKRLFKLVITGLQSTNQVFLERFIDDYLIKKNNKLTELVIKNLWKLVQNHSTKNVYLLTLQPPKDEQLQRQEVYTKLEGFRHRRIAYRDEKLLSCNCCGGVNNNEIHRFYSNSLR
ncbi:unnamed protein product [Moneuplotes crassus]|uniref:Uncharacterized protein n=1 Tax=Euplotes crassus TaxID=5936 RepID=A0AAD1XEV5_EUPCR|nr:unnamed protein product [Moneuplotes crassus]